MSINKYLNNYHQKCILNCYLSSNYNLIRIKIYITAIIGRSKYVKSWIIIQLAPCQKLELKRLANCPVDANEKTQEIEQT